MTAAVPALADCGDSGEESEHDASLASYPILAGEPSSAVPDLQIQANSGQLRN